MDRFIVREPRAGTDYPQGNQMMAFSANSGGNMMVPETIYLGGAFAPEFTNMPVSPAMNVPHVNRGNMMPPNMNDQRMYGFNITGQRSNNQCNVYGQHDMNFQAPQGSNVAGQGHTSGVDRYLSGYTDNSAQFIMTGQQIQRSATPINSIGNEYQNRSFTGIDRNKQKSFAPQVIFTEPPRAIPETSPKPHVQQIAQATEENKKIIKNIQQINTMPLPNKPNGLDLPRNDIQNQIVTRADKLKALHKSGPRAFSGPVEKVLKWHKSLQDIGVLIFYEIVAKCVSVRPGESCSKILVVRDDKGPAMQVVYYEIDFLLPEFKPPCTIRVIGKMMTGASRLQAFSVRPATGDDVAMLPRRAAIAAHHVAKLCKEYAANTV